MLFVLLDVLDWRLQLQHLYELQKWKDVYGFELI